MKSHKDLDVWKAAVALAVDIYALTRRFPKEELFGMTSQMRRSANSIASNIAEGAARQTRKEFVQYLHIALGSGAELETQIEIAKKVELCKESAGNEIDRALLRIRRMLLGLIESLRRANVA